MEDRRTKLITTDDVEILLPEREDSRDGMERCVCCGRLSVLDSDCCGICEDVSLLTCRWSLSWLREVQVYSRWVAWSL